MKTRRYQIAAILAVLILMTACPSQPQALRESRKAAHRIQVAVDSATDTTAVLYHDQIITQEKKNAIVKILMKVNAANRVLIDKAAAATADTPSLRAELLTALSQIESALAELNAAGVLGIKTKEGQLAFETVLQTMTASINIIKGVLQ